jgi:hypothetical protein
MGAPLNLSLHYPSVFGPADPGEDDEVTFARLFAAARRGFPQGSATSAIAVEMLLAPLFEQLPQGGEAINYADNVLMMAKDKNDVVSMCLAFGAALEAHPVGQLRPKEPRVFPPGTPIEFLGHRLELINGMVRISPTQRNIERLETKFANGIRKIKGFNAASDQARRHVQELRRYVSSWLASFKLCDGIESYRVEALDRIDNAVPLFWKCK